MKFTINGAKIKRLRTEQNITRSYLARVVRRSPFALDKWESGETRTTDEQTIEAVAHALGVTPYDISPDYMPPRDPLLGRVYFDQELAQRTKALRRLTYRDLCERSGIPLMSLHYIMTKDKPSADAEHIYSIAVALGLQPGELSQPLAAAPTPQDREYRKSAGVPYTY